jgi:hypothetical protein
VKSSPANGFGAPAMRTVANDADGREDDGGGGDGATVRANPLKTNDEVAADGADANIPGMSATGKNDALHSMAR